MQISFPGFFDLQVNGFAGADFNDPRTTPQDICRAIETMQATGVTRFLPTLITSSFDHFAQCAHTINQVNSAIIAGFHLEGPYISPEEGPRGAHPRQHVAAASVEDFKRRQEATQGRIVLVTLAPEVEGAISLIEYLVGQHISVAIGHTNAAPAQIRDAVKAGATLSTHLGNGCANVLPRHPNFLWEQLASDELQASFIVDGHHLPPATVKAMIRAKGLERSILVTDAIAAAGCAPGVYELSGLTVVLDESGRVAPPDALWLAGSAVTMNKAVANAVKFTGLSLHEILPMASTQPAAYIGQRTAGYVKAEWNEKTCDLRVLQVEE
jgi:N-acetylglucosamine-6-phosphate deacetylase